MSEQRFSKIKKDLDDVAQEANFIGLNAHIEASKADGESGRRFSIVSQEMTKLSKKLETTIKELSVLCERQG